jgi:hypothetical protein
MRAHDERQLRPPRKPPFGIAPITSDLQLHQNSPAIGPDCRALGCSRHGHPSLPATCPTPHAPPVSALRIKFQNVVTRRRNLRVTNIHLSCRRLGSASCQSLSTPSCRKFTRDNTLVARCGVANIYGTLPVRQQGASRVGEWRVCSLSRTFKLFLPLAYTASAMSSLKQCRFDFWHYRVECALDFLLLSINKLHDV